MEIGCVVKYAGQICVLRIECFGLGYMVYDGCFGLKGI